MGYLGRFLILMLALYSGRGIHHGVDPVFIPFVEEYKTNKYRFTGSSQTKNFSIQLYNIDSDEAGECLIIDQKYYVIRIDPNFWFKRSTSDTDRTILIHHELGHCDLEIKHHQGGIMHEYVFPSSAYLQNPEGYLKDLFLGRHF